MSGPTLNLQQDSIPAAFKECCLSAASLALCRLARPFSLLVLYMLTVTALSTRSLPCLSCLRQVRSVEYP